MAGGGAVSGPGVEGGDRGAAGFACQGEGWGGMAGGEGRYLKEELRRFSLGKENAVPFFRFAPPDLRVIQIWAGVE